jgi:NAD(P)-dependent dehydrogenase (short-subunit alcohol dehydrogenase family)
MKVGITGHTKGIGKEISEYFLKNSYEVVGFSRSSGYDISKEIDRNKILEQLDHFDIFVNNAYNNFDDSQLIILESIIDKWKDREKIIINVSSRWTDSDHPYSLGKLSLDKVCEKYKNSKVYIINLKPGLTDTERVKSMIGNKMKLNSISTIIDFIISNRNNFRIHSITFGK